LSASPLGNRNKSSASGKSDGTLELQPAHDTGLTPSERFRSVRREKGLLESFAHHACFSLIRSYFAVAHRLTIIDREKLPAHGPFVLAANHCSHLDALALAQRWLPAIASARFPSPRRRLFSNESDEHIFGNHA